MKKEHLYACLCVFVITLTLCVIVATLSYCNKNRKPVAKISYGKMITYETQVDSPLTAARLYQRLKAGYIKSLKERVDAEISHAEAQRESDDDPEEWFK